MAGFSAANPAVGHNLPTWIAPRSITGHTFSCVISSTVIAERNFWVCALRQSGASPQADGRMDGWTDGRNAHLLLELALILGLYEVSRTWSSTGWIRI